MQVHDREGQFSQVIRLVRSVGGLAGLIGLGDAEFRLPVLMHGVGFDAKSAVPLNLMISLVTLSFAMVARSGTISATAILP